MSAHERRLLRLREVIGRMEEAAVGPRSWELTGEVDAAARPLNSALEVDLDFERTVRPPPQPTEETTQSLEDLIKRRVADRRFDDVVRVLAAAPRERRPELELNDSKDDKGLAELYEESFLRQADKAQASARGLRPFAPGTMRRAPASPPQGLAAGADDRDEPVRREARQLFRELCARLDALSHFVFAPKPVVEDLEVRANLPAIAMEEVLPVAASEAALKAPEEVYRPATKTGEIRAAEELAREDRRRARAARKRAAKSDRGRKEQERAEGDAPVAGRRSEEQEREVLRKAKKRARASASDANYAKSSAVFAKIQEASTGGAAAASRRGKEASDPSRPRSSNLKL